MLQNPKLHLGVTLWLLAMTGVVMLASSLVPQLLAQAPRTISPAVAFTAMVAQSGIVLLLAVCAGVTLAKPLGLGAPAVEAALSGSGVWAVLKRQLGPAAVAGLIVAGLLLVAQRIAPAGLQAAGQTVELPLAAKLLYGGITEEVLMRWGLMTVLIWLPWRLVLKKADPPRTAHVIAAILVTAVLFGIAHLPAATAMGVHLTAPVITFIIIGNTLPGVLFGLLYWRYGIEAAIMAHALGHGLTFPATLATLAT
jgi:hypothetical protein